MSDVAVHACRADLDEVGAMLSRAFADDPVQQWMFEPAADPDGARERFLRFMTDCYFELGNTFVTGANAGAALWAPPDLHALGDAQIGPLIELATADLGDEAIPRLTEMGRAMELAPAEPHFYLGIAGVDPAHQSRGYGARLLEPTLAACDREGFLAYLESSNPKNITFYQRHGFQVVDEIVLGGPGGPTLVPMRREPALR